MNDTTRGGSPAPSRHQERRDPNPYAAPSSAATNLDRNENTEPQATPHHLRMASRYLVGIGKSGAFLTAVSGVIMMTFMVSSVSLRPLFLANLQIICVLLGLFFFQMIRTGIALRDDFDRLHRRARVMVVSAGLITWVLLPFTLIAIGHLNKHLAQLRAEQSGSQS